jgi:hypothetical protein
MTQVMTEVEACQAIDEKLRAARSAVTVWGAGAMIDEARAMLAALKDRLEPHPPTRHCQCFECRLVFEGELWRT